MTCRMGDGGRGTPRPSIHKLPCNPVPCLSPCTLQLPLYPLVKAGLITTEDIIIDAKSGKKQDWRHVQDANARMGLRIISGPSAGDMGV